MLSLAPIVALALAPVAAGPDDAPSTAEAAAAAEPTSPEAPAPAVAPAVAPKPAPAVEAPKRRTVKVHPGRGMTIAGAVITGLGLAGRLGVDVFLGTVADLQPREPYGTWSVGPFFMATTFTNVPTLVGVGLLGGGAYREGHRDGGLRGTLPDRRKKQIGWGLLGGGLGLWALSRALFYPWVRVCESNACAYGWLETTYYASAGLAIVGLRGVAYQAGLGRAKRERDADYIHITPVLSPTLQGLALSGRF